MQNLSKTKDTYITIIFCGYSSNSRNSPRRAQIDASALVLQRAARRLYACLRGVGGRAWVDVRGRA